MPRPRAQPDGLDHRGVGLDAGEQPVDQAVRLDLEQRRELQLEGLLLELARLQRDQQLARLRVAAEAPEQLRGSISARRQ